MDAPAMFTRKQVPEDVGHRNTAGDESATGGQGQLHRDEKEQKPVLKKVKEKVKKIKHTLTGHSRGDGHGDEHGQQVDRADDDDANSDDEEEGDAALEREAATEKGGYMEDVEDKHVAMEPEPEVHGAPMYDSERTTPAVQDLVAKYDPARAPAAQEAQGADAPGARFGNLGGAAVHDPAAREAHGADAPRVRFGNLDGAAVHDPAAQEARRDDDSPKPKVRLGDLGGPAVEDPAAPRSTTPAAREGEDIGSTPVVQQFESMTLSDDPEHVGAGKQGARAEEWKDTAADNMGGATYTDKLKNVAAVPAEYSKKFVSTVYEKVAGGGTAAGAGKRDGESAEATPVSDAGASREEWKDAPAAMDNQPSSGPGYTDKIKSTAASTTEYSKQFASTLYEKVAGVVPATGAGKRDDEHREAADVGGSREEWKDAPAAVDTTDRSSGPGYTDKIKSTASPLYEKVAGVVPATGAGKREDERREAVDVGGSREEWKDAPAAVDTTDRSSGPGYTDKIKSTASTLYEKVAGVVPAVAPSLRPQVGAGKPEEEHNNAMPVSDVGAEERKEATAADAAERPSSGPGYTDKIKSAATTAYQKVAGVGTAVVGKVQQVTPGTGAQQDRSASTVTPGNGQDKGVTTTGYIAEKLRPGDEERSLSEAISSAVQRHKEGVVGTVGQRVPAPSQVITKAREAVTSLTGGNRVSETAQPNVATGAEVKENVAAEAPVLRGEEVGEPKLNTNTM